MFITITTLIAIFKKEKDCTLEDNHVKFNVLQSYSLLWYIMKLPNVQLLAMIMLTVKVNITFLFLFLNFTIHKNKIRNMQNMKCAIAHAVGNKPTTS